MHPAVERLLAALPAWRERLGRWNQAGSLGHQKPSVIVPEDIQSDCYYGFERMRETVRDSLKRHFPPSCDPRPPLFKIGAVASANVLLKDTRILAQWRAVARHIVHVEMEAGGVYTAARHGGANELPLLCVRGISDIVGFKRHEAWTGFACDSAASFLHALLTAMPSEAFGITPHQPVSPNRNTTPTLEAINEAFERTSAVLLRKAVDAENRIPRPELNALEHCLSQYESAVNCILGVPGSGKTALLALFARHAIDFGIATLAIKADLVPTDVPFGPWLQQELGLGITAMNAIKAASTQSRVLVVVDQLDALASTVDLASDRLNAVIDFIGQCAMLHKVTVVCSCRDFDFRYDARFSALDASEIALALPAWEDVVSQLAKNGIKHADTWPDAFREVLRNPQHLSIYLHRFRETRNTDPFDSYQLMLDDLWTRTIVTLNEHNLIYQLTAYLVEPRTYLGSYCTFRPR